MPPDGHKSAPWQCALGCAAREMVVITKSQLAITGGLPRWHRVAGRERPAVDTTGGDEADAPLPYGGETPSAKVVAQVRIARSRFPPPLKVVAASDVAVIASFNEPQPLLPVNLTGIAPWRRQYRLNASSLAIAISTRLTQGRRYKPARTGCAAREMVVITKFQLAITGEVVRWRRVAGCERPAVDTTGGDEADAPSR